jgi:hypothetical protein
VVESVYSAVRTDSLYKADCVLLLKDECIDLNWSSKPTDSFSCVLNWSTDVNLKTSYPKRGHYCTKHIFGSDSHVSFYWPLTQRTNLQMLFRQMRESWKESKLSLCRTVCYVDTCTTFTLKRIKKKTKVHDSQQYTHTQIYIIFSGPAAQRGLWPPRHLRYLDHTQRHAAVGRFILDEWSARRRDLYLTTHNR